MFNMEPEISREIEIIIWIISAVLGGLVVWRLKKQNKKTLNQIITGEENSFIISNYVVETNFLDKFKTMIIISSVMSIGIVLLVVSIFFGLYIAGTFFDGVAGYIAAPDLVLLVSVVPIMLLITFGVLAFLFTMYSPMSKSGQPLQSKHIPHFLTSKKFSHLDEPFIVVTKEGIEGWFALAWKRVYSVTKIDHNRLLVCYKRWPHWLTTLLKADSFILNVPEKAQAEEIIKLWSSGGTR